MAPTDHPFLDGLNDAQLEAVTYCDTSSLVIAGAGAGKTRVLTCKIAYLLANGYRPWDILALTFTNKAAREMKERIARLCGGSDLASLWAGTFHSVFLRILRMECQTIGFDHNFTIYDQADSRQLIKSIVKEFQLDDKVYKPATVGGYISDAKNRLILPAAYAQDRDLLQRDKHHNIGQLHRVYAAYVERCRRANALDFDDLLLHTYLLFRHHPDVCRKYQERFRYILVDEYQDTNYAQYSIINQLAAGGARLCVVGDDAQSIYAFRGANIRNILDFQATYPDARLIKLERNYRSTQTIVNAANSIISHNQGRIPKTIYSRLPQGEPIVVYETFSDKDESLRIARDVGKLHRTASLSYSEMAVLYRTNAQSRSFEESFQSLGIPFRIYGGLSFYQRKEVKDVLAYFRLICNPADDEALVRIINYPARGIGSTTVTKILTAARQADRPMWEALAAPAELGVNKGTAAKLTAFAGLIDGFRELQEQMSVCDFAMQVIQGSGIMDDLRQEHTPEALSRVENVQELISSIQQFEQEQREAFGNEHPRLTDYLAQAALYTDQDQAETDEPHVTLMTVHAAKGLEFDTVFVTGLENNLFPNQSAAYDPREMEEERRLFYVAVTRAKNRCRLSYARSRFRYGQVDYPQPSPFLREIDPQYLTRETTAAPAPRSAVSTYRSQRAASPSGYLASAQKPGERFRRLPQTAASPSEPRSEQTSAPAYGIRVGSHIVHNRFGRGEVLRIEGTGSETQALVRFANAGERKLLLKFASFQVAD